MSKTSDASPAPLANFVDVAAKAGLTAQEIFGGVATKKYIIETTGTGVAIFDYDNDGWPDIFIVNGRRLESSTTSPSPTNHLYRNNHDGTFADVTEKAGLAQSGWGQGVCVGDYENDGWEDLYVSYYDNMNAAPSLLVNQVRNKNHWIAIRTVGTKSNRDGIGPKIPVKTATRMLVDEVRSGSSYSSNSDMRVHFGLGSALKVDWVEVRWPSGFDEQFTNLAVDQIHVLTEGSGGAITADPKKKSHTAFK